MKNLKTFNEKTTKTKEEFITYMYKIYPNDNQLPEREGMLKAYKFLTGEYDAEEKEKQKIKIKIGETINKNFSL